MPLTVTANHAGLRYLQREVCVSRGPMRLHVTIEERHRNHERTTPMSELSAEDSRMEAQRVLGAFLDNAMTVRQMIRALLPIFDRSKFLQGRFADERDNVEALASEDCGEYSHRYATDDIRLWSWAQSFNQELSDSRFEGVPPLWMRREVARGDDGVQVEDSDDAQQCSRKKNHQM